MFPGNGMRRPTAIVSSALPLPAKMRRTPPKMQIWSTHNYASNGFGAIVMLFTRKISVAFRILLIIDRNYFGLLLRYRNLCLFILRCGQSVNNGEKDHSTMPKKDRKPLLSYYCEQRKFHTNRRRQWSLILPAAPDFSSKQDYEQEAFSLNWINTKWSKDPFPPPLFKSCNEEKTFLSEWHSGALVTAFGSRCEGTGVKMRLFERETHSFAFGQTSLVMQK